MVEGNPRGARPGNRSCVSGTSAIHGGRARSRARRLVLQGLYQWQISGASAGDIIMQLLLDQDAHDTDTEYFEMLLREVVTDCDVLEQLYGKHLDRPAAQLDPIERSILLLGTCELRSYPEVPYRVVLNEAVELSKKFGAEDGYKYINAVLEKICAELRAMEYNQDLRRSRMPR